MFVDQVNIYVKAGDGGDGKVAYRREIYEPKGGPSGGDGGYGGDVIFQVDEGLNTLMDFRYNRHYKAKPGESGMSKNKHGRGADPLIVAVPPGTIVSDKSTGERLANLTTEGEQAVIAKGGRGGRGNTRFASSRHTAPELSENGEPGEERQIVVELKLLADVGLIGFPSSGKSTLLSVVSAAKPKTADYHFTTLTPKLGVVETTDERSFVLADLPGLIEGAHKGVGLGQQFLRHIERTRILIHVIDMASIEARSPYNDFTTINQELEAYDPAIIERPQIIAANKMDMPGAEENLRKFKENVAEDIPIYPISALTKDGIQQLIYAVADKLDHMPVDDNHSDLKKDEQVVYSYQETDVGFQITRDSDGVFVISGQRIEKLFKMTDFTKDEGAERFARQMRRMGIDEELRKRGAKDGDIIRILDFEFEFIE